MAIAQFSFGSPNDKITNVQKLERDSKLYSRPINGTPCRFRTCYNTQIFPIELQDAKLESSAPKDARGKFAESYIKLSMRCFGDANLHELKIGETGEPPESLRFFLNGDPQLTFPLYELIFNHASAVEFRAKETPLGDRSMTTMTNIRLTQPKPVILSADAIRQVGFDEPQGMLPYTKRSFIGYRLLTEYFTFPYKFMFFDIFGLDQAILKKFGSHFDIIIHLKDITPPRTVITADNFKLGCTPIVNLFNQTADPIYLSQKKYEYHVVPDVHRQSTTEIYSIDEVNSTDPQTNTNRTFEPFYSQKHAYGEQMEKVFWYANRRQSQRQDDDGTEIFMTTVDMQFNPRTPAAEVLTVKTTCTNRDLPAKLPFGGKDNDFEVEGTALLSKVRCLTKPTETIRPPQRRAAQWRLISHLNLNHLSLTSTDALQEILQLYNFDDSSATRKQILGIKSVESRKIVKQIGGRIGTGFVRGLETTIEFDEEEFVGSSYFLFGCVLERFLGVYASLNSFNQLVVKTKQREGVVKRFEARAGEQILL
jgi:type VI secretion system protein ImpG